MDRVRGYIVVFHLYVHSSLGITILLLRTSWVKITGKLILYIWQVHVRIWYNFWKVNLKNKMLCTDNAGGCGTMQWSLFWAISPQGKWKCWDLSPNGVWFVNTRSERNTYSRRKLTYVSSSLMSIAWLYWIQYHTLYLHLSFTFIVRFDGTY